MGKGDKRTAKGKRFQGSFGNTRPKKTRNKIALTVRKGLVKPV